MAEAIQIPSEGVLEDVFKVYERGLTVDALREAEKFAELKNWGGVHPCVLAARIAVNTGAPRLASRLSVRAWRTDRSHPEAQFQYGFELTERRGPLAAWRRMRDWKISSRATADEQADLFALRARLATDLRDFGLAEKFVQEAEALGNRRAWIRLQRAHLLERQDRVEEALEIARAAIACHPFPFYRPGVQTAAHLLQLLDRDDEAVQLLEQAGGVIQNGPVAAQLYGILSENGRWREAEAALLRYVDLSPLLEPPLQKWVASQRARAAYHLGKNSEAAGFARELDDEFHKNFAKNLEAAGKGPDRVQLNVSFVRQHFKTCAPATLAALGQFWRMPAEHLKLAEAMCYDGTPSAQQRDWAEHNGWFVREFRVTHESALALIARGVPFAISTVEATSAHMQAFVGFDRTRGTILLRDPGQPYVIEAFAETFFKYHRPFGPHGMVFLPEAEKSKLDGIELPDMEIYDAQHRFNLCLKRYDRAGAAEISRAMATAHGEHALVWETRLFLAGYDANVSEQMLCLDKLLELFPNNPARLLRRLGCLRDASRQERIEFLEKICAGKDVDPVMFIELARALGQDARSASTAAHWLKRAMRFRPLDSNAITVQADLLWSENRLEEATELYRFAACLEGYRENLYQAWFSACRRTRRTDEAMAVLEDRFKRFGARSEQPGMTLAWAWREMDQLLRAREVYVEASRLRPDNGYLLLNAASLEMRLRNREETEKFLQAARDKVRKADWLRSRAEIAEWRLDAATSLQTAREILEIEPLALDAHGSVARALAQLEGTSAALAHLSAACAQFPHHYGLRRMLVDWSRDSTDAAETAVRELLRIDPADAWARRELAMTLVKAGRFDDALHEAGEAAQVEPRNSYSFSVLGHVRERRKELDEARTCLRRAIELSVDNSNALHTLLDLTFTDRERKEELAFIEKQLITQVVSGDGLLAFRELAEPILEPEVLLKSLQLAHQERPDLWHAWSALGCELGHLNRLDEALALARQAADRFPQMPRIWLDLSAIHQWRQESEAEIAAARRAFEMNPAWNRGTLALGGALERAGKLEEAKEVYERALQHSPKDAQLRSCLAHLLWRLRQPEAAIAEVENALRNAPGYTWPWELLRDWSAERGEPNRAGDFARKLTKERPGEMRVWLMLAHTLPSPDATTERLAAVDRALALEHHATEAWDAKAELLAFAERFDEAIQAAQDGARMSPADAYILRGRAAWIEARRRRLPDAVRLMREVLTENSAYVWGWSQLSQWLLEQGSLDEATTALETLQRLRPHDAWVSRQLGFLKLKRDDRAGARKCFAAALQVSPTDVYAAQNLLDLQIKADDLPEAGQTLRIMQMHQPGAATQTAEIFVLLAKNEMKAANALLQKVCSSSDPDVWPLDAATNAYLRAGRTPHALKVFKRAIQSGSGHPQVAAAAIRVLNAQRRSFAAVWLFLGLKSIEWQRRAATPLVHGLVEARARFLFRWVLWRRRPLLAEDDAAWGQVGYAWSTFKSYKQAALWLSDWRNHRVVEPWMLFNLCFSLRQLGRYPEAAEVAQHAVQKWGHREGSADLRLFIAVEEALAGNTSVAQEQLKHVSARDKVPYDQDLLSLANALVEFQLTPPADRARHSKTIRQRLAKRFTEGRMLKVMKDVRWTFRRTGKIFGEQGGGWRAKLWFGWRLNWHYSIVLLLPLLAIVVVFPPAVVGLLVGLGIRQIRRG